jgi:hypothetical protein
MTSITPFSRQLKSELLSSAAAAALLREEDVAAACRAGHHRGRSCFWRPAVTILTFLRQVLNGNCSCRQAVQLTIAASAAGDVGVGPESDVGVGPVGDAGVGPEGDGRVSGDPSAYGQSRQTLPRATYDDLARRTSESVKRAVGHTRLWCGRLVRLVDGSSVSMPDTGELQHAFPQPSGQKRGCGFPVARLVGLFCWSSGALLELVEASLRVGELTLFRRLMDRIESGAVVVGDRLFGSYYDLHLLMKRGLDGVFRLHQRRSADLRRGTHLGPCDHLITWTKSKKPPLGVSAATWADVPETLTVRHVRVIVETPGFRSRRIELITTLLDPEPYPAEELARLYRDRWAVELNLRHMKTTLKMEVLKCQSVEMVRKELRMYQIAYNLIRLLMWQAAEKHGRDPHRLSFAGTQQRINAMLPFRDLCRTAAQRAAWAEQLLEWIAADVLPDRPNRVEPRCVKRRPKNYRRLTRPRHEARRVLLSMT